jgi:membrane protease subunit (stomatin/prohibitin family)
MGGLIKGLEFADIRWGTMMPVTVMVESKICQFRARGTCSVRVEDPALANGKVDEPDAEGGFLRPYLMIAVTDAIGELSTQGPPISDFTSVSAKVAFTIQERMATLLASMGMTLTAVRVEAVEDIG